MCLCCVDEISRAVDYLARSRLLKLSTAEQTRPSASTLHPLRERISQLTLNEFASYIRICEPSRNRNHDVDNESPHSRKRCDICSDVPESTHQTAAGARRRHVRTFIESVPKAMVIGGLSMHWTIGDKGRSYDEGHGGRKQPRLG